MDVVEISPQKRYRDFSAAMNTLQLLTMKRERKQNTAYLLPAIKESTRKQSQINATNASVDKRGKSMQNIGKNASVHVLVPFYSDVGLAIFRGNLRLQGLGGAL